ncbi:hypothetical protein KOR34_20660 [Posidoniimonas corsicana]|uniref:AAA+ ATPase domain-containing protein n=1 Tax=Posidoniimonas corsicana TaxID=1938618 RepID=A0A5C5VGU0_9BACT|nr:hypothetical protein [Posidoniimonas corsicana]TWT37119.1 hypothetical protein KOR34_20660 [Posidoniimonas corsicana]
MHTIADTESLNPVERAVVELAAANRGAFEVSSRSDTKGPAIRGGKKKLFKPDDLAYARRCCDAIPRLIELQLVRHASGKNGYELTNFGWQLSRKLSQQSRAASLAGSSMSIDVTQPITSANTPQQEERPNATLNLAPGESLLDQLEERVAEETADAQPTPGNQSLSIRPGELAREILGESGGDQPPQGGATLNLSSEAPSSDNASLSFRPGESARDLLRESDAELPPRDGATLNLSSEDDVFDQLQQKVDAATAEADASPNMTVAPPPKPAAPAVGADSAPTWRTSKSKDADLLSSLGLNEGFRPEEPRTLEETGLSIAFIDDLVLKVVQNAGSISGREIAEHVCLPLAVLEDRFAEMRKRRTITPTASAMLGDHVYQLTDEGRQRAAAAMRECAYAGVAPVPLDDYVDSVQAQTIRTEKPKRPQLEKAFSDINVEPEMLAQLGPAISAGKGMFIYGPPGNGKTTVAQRITKCFGQNILVPHAIVEDGQIIKFFDPSCHEPVQSKAGSLLKASEHDRRWVRIRRPTVVVGGELTMDSLELKHDHLSHVSEASLQLKSNCGSLLIDDFGRQRVNPTELLNRWIIPLENRIDYLGLANGKKIEVPFEQLIIFSTNLDPTDLADDAFLRRIPFKIEVGAPSRDEFIKLFGIFAKKLKVDCPQESLDYLLATHYDSCDRPFRRCQARDLLDQVAHYCEYNELEPTAVPEILDHAVNNYFTVMADE